MKNSDLKEMLDAAVHFGHKTQKWNPKMKKYIHTAKNGVHIFDLQKTADCLDKACEYLSQEVSKGKRVLLVSTKPQAADLIKGAANDTGMPYVVHKWMGGLLTNFSTMKQRIKYFKKLREEEKSGDFGKYTKKEASMLKKDIVKLESALGGVRDMERTPDIIFVGDAVRDKIVIKEANKLHIPVVAIVDSNADPEGVSYPIPGNDDAIKSLTYLINVVKNAMLTKKTSK